MNDLINGSLGFIQRSTQTGTILNDNPHFDSPLRLQVFFPQLDLSTRGDGAYPSYGLTSDGTGNYFGVTPVGGTYGQGVIFEFTP